MGPIQTLQDFLGMLRRRVVLVAAVAVFGALLAVFYALSLPRTYEAVAVIQVESPAISEELASTGGSAARRLQLIEQRLMARDNLLELIERHGLFSDLPLTPSEKVVAVRMSVSLRIIAAANSHDGSVSAMLISARLGDPQVTADVANDFAAQVMEQGAQTRSERTREALSFFVEEEARLSAEMAALEAELADFKTTNDAALPANQETFRAELARLTETVLQLEQEERLLSRERAELALDADRAVVQRRIAVIDSEIAALREERALLDTRRADLRATLASAPEVERQVAAYERRLLQLQDQFRLTSQRRAEAEIGQRLEASQQAERFVLLEAAMPPDYPIAPSRKRIVAMGGMVSLFLGLGLALLLEIRNPVLRSAEQFERETGLRPVVTIPYVPGPEDATRDRRNRSLLLAGGTLLLAAIAWLAFS